LDRATWKIHVSNVSHTAHSQVKSKQLGGRKRQVLDAIFHPIVRRYSVQSLMFPYTSELGVQFQIERGQILTLCSLPIYNLVGWSSTSWNDLHLRQCNVN